EIIMQRIFIVEDDSKLAELLHDTVLKYGFESYIATDFQQIMEEFKNYDPHLVLLDINLPSFDGYYWCRMIRQVSTCPIIFIRSEIIMQRIFIVEDDSKLAELLHDTVLKYGFESYIATDFQQIMEEFKNYDPHLVLLDINLPSFDGYYWCRMIRQVSTCPIIFISARIGEMDQVMALENGG